ncbi:MAG: VWA domain-containing protein, partial [Nostoc sp. DedQUE04]|uniref:VWA domain-containing protein n=1 Tax=Nostoc sp. DedQUE04 TaxID=3075390 RepID=UPI002AD2870C
INSARLGRFVLLSLNSSNENSINHVYLFSDGNPSSGETDWIKIRQNLTTKTRGSIRLSTFAFGSDANARELNTLAGSASGRYTFVTDPSTIKFNLRDELYRREYLAAINVQVSIEIDPEVLIMYLYGHDQITDSVSRAAVLKNVEGARKKAKDKFGVKSAPDIITQDKGIRIFVPDLAVGETYWIVFELGIPKGKTSASVGQATVQYVNTFARNNEQYKLRLTPRGNLPPDLVVRQALGLWTSEVAFYALDDLYQQDLVTAETHIQNHVSLLGTINADLQSESISDDMITLRKFVSLAQNLGKLTSNSDRPSQATNVVFVQALNEFGRIRNGFNQPTAASAPKAR